MSRKSVKLNGVELNAKVPFLISGPCVIEGVEVMQQTAKKIAELREKLGIEIIYKSSFQKDNRSSLQNYFGPGIEEGLKILKKIKAEYGLSVLSDIHSPDQAEPAAEVLDIIQIPAYLCMQTSLLVAAAKTKKIINIKHGQFLAPQNMVYPVNKCLESGNDQLILTERGVCFGYNDLVVDPRSFYEMEQLGYPVIFDITHSIRKYGIPSSKKEGGARQYIPTLAKIAGALGLQGIFLEAHPNPDTAKCDAASQLPLSELEACVSMILDIHKTAIKYN